MKDKLPTVVIILAALVVGVFFFFVIKPFVLPMIFAGVLAVLCWPWYTWVRKLCRGHGRVAAAITTLLILLLVLVPVGGGLVLAGGQLFQAAKRLSEDDVLLGRIEELLDSPEDQGWQTWVNHIRAQFTEEDVEQLRQSASSLLLGAARGLYDRTRAIVADVFSFVLGLIVFSLALYYFLADKEMLLGELRRLSPLTDEDNQALTDNFVSVCRDVLLGNVMAAAVQAVLNGIGLAVAGISQVWLLVLCTFLLSMIPFLGAGVIWGAAAIALAIEGRYVAAILLALYGAAIVSTVDNLIRAHAFRGRSHIHPLVALISILGAIQLIGLWGVIIGPVAAAFFYALLNLLDIKRRGELDVSGGEA